MIFATDKVKRELFLPARRRSDGLAGEVGRRSQEHRKARSSPAVNKVADVARPPQSVGHDQRRQSGLYPYLFMYPTFPNYVNTPRGEAAGICRLRGRGAMDEHRIAPRRRVLKAGSIEFGGGAVPCTIRSISSSGAALEVTSPLWFPDHFILLLVSEGLRRACQIVWRREMRVGVKFTDH